MLEILGNLIAPAGRLLAAILIFLVALAAAEIAKSFIVKFLRKIKVDEKLKVFGLEEEKTSNYIELVGKIIYLSIMILILPSMFDILGISSVSEPIVSMLRNVFAFAPRVLAAIVIMLVGIVLGEIASSALHVLLVSIGTDTLLEKNGIESKMSLSTWISSIVKWVIYIVAFVEAANALQLAVLSHIGAMLIQYIPYGIAAAFVFIAALFFGSLAEHKVRELWPQCKKAPGIIKTSIIVVGFFVALSQLQIAQELINGLILICVASVALALALSFGLGGQKFAANVLERLEEKLFGKKED